MIPPNVVHRVGARERQEQVFSLHVKHSQHVGLDSGNDRVDRVQEKVVTLSNRVDRALPSTFFVPPLLTVSSRIEPSIPH